MPHAVTTTDVFLEQISGQLDELIGILRPEPPAEPEPAADDAPTAGEPATVSKKPPVKKATARKRVTGQ